jgi:DNA polymerase elongation subunit (family B)
MYDYVYDIETYPNVFLAAFEHVEYPITLLYEVSPWRNDGPALLQFLDTIRQQGGRLIGFNNLAFDYPILHMAIKMNRVQPDIIYQKVQAMFDAQDEDKWAHQVYAGDRYINQIDLFKIHHFDNNARSTSLKALEFNMRSKTIQDLPFKPGTILDQDQILTLRQYNRHDVNQTKLFYTHTLDMLSFREKLNTMYPGRDWLNFNDTKIGKEYFVMRLEQAGVACYDFGPAGRTPRQTQRHVIRLRDAIIPWVQFDQPEFRRVLEWLKQQEITETKGVFSDLTASIDGFEFVFGTGGIHGSVESRIIESTDDMVIIDLDVSSYYPNLAIANGFYPQHLGETFCTIYKSLYEQRKQYGKKTAENAMLKLALNGVYGDSNNRFSVFYDPLFTMKITLNGQLLLCMLAEQLMAIRGLQIIQINTDGLTVNVPRTLVADVLNARTHWEMKTGLTLEDVTYKAMMIRDVNNYIAVREDGGVKRKGAYEYVTSWHQNAGGLVIPKVAEKVLVEGAPIRKTVENWPDRMDFMLRTKVPRSSYLQWGEQQVQNITRYYIAKGGKPLTKWMPPLKGKTEWRKIAVESGWNVQVCNDLDDATLPIDYEYYIKEVEKLTLGLQ